MKEDTLLVLGKNNKVMQGYGKSLSLWKIGNIVALQTEGKLKNSVKKFENLFSCIT